jgi:hypothetical protein
MKPNLMHRLAHNGCHKVAPQGYHTLPNVTGDYDLDATILHRTNTDMPKRLELYVKRGKGGCYGPLTGYNGYHGYHGDN